MNTYSSSFIDLGTMSQQNRQAFMTSFISTHHESCVAILPLTAQAKQGNNAFLQQQLQYNIPLISDTAYSTDTYCISFIYFGTMSQQNRQAFMVSFLSSNHESCEPSLINTETIMIIK